MANGGEDFLGIENSKILPTEKWGWQGSALQEILAPELRSYVRIGS
jgi:hypothetical protein